MKNSCIVCKTPLNKGATKYCSQACDMQNRYDTFISDWLSGLVDGNIGSIKPKPSKHIYRFFRENFDSCNICNINIWLNKPIMLELDHINGIRADSTIDNLRLLCPNCHSQTETFRNKIRPLAQGEQGDL